MKPLKYAIQVAMLFLGAVVILATSAPPESDQYISEEWVVANLFDGQTSVIPDLEIQLTIGGLDFDPENGDNFQRATKGMESVRLYPADDTESTILFKIEMAEEDCVLIPEKLMPDTEYVLDSSGLKDALSSARIIPEPIHFRTGSLPRVTGLWRNGDTLLIAFSEPMNPDDLFLGHASIDIFWQDQDELQSIVTDLNLADFTEQVDTNLYMVAPINFLDTGWVRISGQVRGQSGVTLDGNGDGATNGLGDDFIEEVNFGDLLQCFTRVDIPAPCVNWEDIPEDWRTDQWQM